MPKLHKDIIVKGIVQGVGFRFSCRQIAKSYGIVGHVKNLSDGSLQIMAEGEEHALRLFIKWCYKGPTGARVSEVEITDGKWESFKAFDIKH